MALVPFPLLQLVGSVLSKAVTRRTWSVLWRDRMDS